METLEGTLEGEGRCSLLPLLLSPFQCLFFSFFVLWLFFKTGFHCVAMAVRELSLWTFYWPLTPRDLPASGLLEPWDTPWETLSTYPHFVYLSLSVCLNLGRGGGHPSQVVLDPQAEEGTYEGNSPFESL